MRDPQALGRVAFSMPCTNLLVTHTLLGVVTEDPGEVVSGSSEDDFGGSLLARRPWFRPGGTGTERVLQLRLDHRTLVQPRASIGHANVNVAFDRMVVIAERVKRQAFKRSRSPWRLSHAAREQFRTTILVDSCLRTVTHE